MRIGFDVSQTGQAKAGCGYLADSLIRQLVEIDANNEYVLYPTFGNGVWDPGWPKTTARPERPNVRIGLGHRTREALDAFWRTPPAELEARLDDPDIVHANNFYCPTTIRRARIVYTLYDVGYLEQPELSTEANRVACFDGLFNASLHADHLLAISAYSRGQLLATFPHYPAERVSVAHPASRFPTGLATAKRPRALEGIEREGFWLAVGTLEPRKNHERLVRAYCRLAADLGNVPPLVLAGGRGWLSGPLERTLEEPLRRGLVKRLGYVSDTELEWLYANCFAFAFPSLDEGFGMPALEAMSLGAPVVVSNAASLPEVVADAGIQVEPRDEDALFMALRRVTTGEIDRRELRQRSRARAREFSWRKTAEHVIDVYREVHAEPHGAWRQHTRVPPAARDKTPGRTLGVNVCGYLRDESGLGTIVRGWTRALQTEGIAVGLRDVSELSVNRSRDTTLGFTDTPTPYPINLVNVNAEQHLVVKQFVGEDFFRDHYNIGVWAWELPTFPAEWHDRFAEYDELWAQSRFIGELLSRVSPIPVMYMPPVLTSSLVGSREAGRRHIDAGPDEFVYLVVFDFLGYIQRKNPMAAIGAFKQAFPKERDVRLVVKCVNEHLDPAAFQAMRALAAGHAVSIHRGYWSARELLDLVAASDVYVSLHRSEGLGLSIAEAMAHSKPVISTGWSGNTDFTTPANSFPVAYELVELAEDVGRYRAGQVWAEPSVDDAARLMRLVYDDRAVATERGRAAQRHIEQHYSATCVGEQMRERLTVISAALAEGRRPPSPERLAPPRRPATPARPRAPRVPRLDLRRSGHGHLGVLVKRGMGYLLRYHTHYQGELNLAFAGFLRELEAENIQLRARVDALTRRADDLSREREHR
jgi:glycosyltransferase involved in cell wall biosynthesis